ncbi:MAG TPA: uroporphyrinogen-III synthase [Devosiaceae bacterium]
MTSLLVTRPEPDVGATTPKLRALGIDPVSLPLMKRITLAFDPPANSDFAATAVSSVNALRALREQVGLERFRQRPLFTVGDGTAREAEVMGFKDIRSARGRFDDLVQLIGTSQPGGPIFYPAGKHRSGDLARSLEPFGIVVKMTQVYDMVEATEIPDDVIARIEAGDIDGGLFYSRRTAESFVRLIGNRLDLAVRERFGTLCISQNVAGPLLDAHFVRVGLAEHPDEEAMMSLALAFARGQNAA